MSIKALRMQINHNEWDKYFITLAYLISMKSKDPSTRVGAVIVDKDNIIRSTGYNGLPRGVYDHSHRYINKDYKYNACNHAEENAILHCARIGISTANCIIYATWHPCAFCTKSIIQAGISEIVFHEEFPGNYNSEKWAGSIEIAKEMLTEAGVAIRSFSGKILKITGLYNSKNFSP